MDLTHIEAKVAAQELRLASKLEVLQAFKVWLLTPNATRDEVVANYTAADAAFIAAYGRNPVMMDSRAEEAYGAAIDACNEYFEGEVAKIDPRDILHDILRDLMGDYLADAVEEVRSAQESESVQARERLGEEPSAR